MKEDARAKKVKFVNRRVYEEYYKLKDGAFEEKELYRLLTGAFRALEKNPLLGVRVPSANWPGEYTKKYDLTRAWRLVYTLEGNDVEVVSIILEWFDSHKKYEKRFGYKKNRRAQASFQSIL
ncbi:MAG: type II toxin-antitoxin system RelE/ParE family toxin [Candidatus Micrarchaeota archaeon]|nr:type II toxin-antitoxin system RelE/ParE family toxin [Candidatus Micrarchaeota archaeon]